VPDFFRDKQGRVRIVRSSPGYDYAFEGLTPKDKEALHNMYGGGYTHTADRIGRLARINALADKTSFASGVRLSPQAKQFKMDKMNERKGLHRRRIY
jgi:hypothetical protein